jgi:hypothetical protein
MMFQLLQMGNNLKGLGPIFLFLGLLVADLVLLKIGLVLTKTKRWKKMKWAVASYFIQFGVVFSIGSPLFLLGIIGAFRGDPAGIIPVVIISAFVDVNVVNVIHRIGLRRSLVVVVIILVPMIFIMSQLGDVLSMFTRLSL